MRQLEVDVAVIGAGSAGLTAFRAARSHHGLRVVLIEGGVHGTTCARVGCMPSKLLIAAADAAHAVSNAYHFGVHAAASQIDGRAVMLRVRNERDRFVGFVLNEVQTIPESARLRGQARFLDSKRLQVDTHTIVLAQRVVIATGSSAIIPNEFQALGERTLVNDTVFDWLDLPTSIAVVGTGVIGLELGQALHRLGVRTAVFGRNKLAQLTDPAVRSSAQHYLSQDFDLRMNSNIVHSERTSNGIQLDSRMADGTPRSEQFDYLLCATGRRPNVDSLALEHTGLALDAHGIPLFDPHTMQCGNSNIFIAGDVSNERPLLHEATEQGRLAGDNAGAYLERRPGLRSTPLSITFCDPQIATLGQSWQQLNNSGAQFAIGEVSFENQGRSRVMRQNAGLLRLYATHKTGRFLGAEMIAPRAEHLAHLLAWAAQNQMTVAHMLQMPFYHPVIEEGLRTGLRRLQKELAAGLPEIDRCADCTPGV